MEQNDFVADKRIRERIGTGRRIYSLIVGLFALTIGLIYIVKHGFSIQDTNEIVHEVYVLMGIIALIITISGKEPFRTRYRLKMDNDSIKIKKSFEWALKIDMKKITYLKSFPQRFEITYNDFVNSYDFSWMTAEELDNFYAKLSDYCLKNKIETNNFIHITVA